MSEPNVILTTIHRLPAAAVAPFFLSLRHCDFSGTVVVFASGVDRASVVQLQQWGAQVEEFRFRGRHVATRLARLWPIWKRVFRSTVSDEAKYRLAHRVFHLFYRRHLLYLDFVREFGGSYERFFLTDCRDVFFQTDPFDWNQSEGLHVFLEDDSMKLDQCKHHTRWIRSQFGEDVLQSLQNEIISCAGTVFGDQSSVKSYLERMVHLTMRARSLREADGDQGIHNFLVRKAPLPGLTIHRNGEGPVMTLGLMRMSDLNFSADDQVVTEGNKVAPVLHQYDRLPELREILLARIRQPGGPG